LQRLRMEANLPNIFSEDSAARDTAFSVVTEILQHSPGVDVSSAMLVLGRSYDEKGGDHVLLDSAKKLIKIMTMVAVRDEDPSFFSNVEVVKVLLGIFSQHGVSEFDEAVEYMFHRFSQSISLAKIFRKDRVIEYFFQLADFNLILESDNTLREFFPTENEEFLIASKALCLKAMVGTFIWKFCCDTERENVWDYVRMAFEAGHVEAVHASLARKIIAVGGSSIGNEELGAMLKAVVPILGNAKDARDGGLCVALCALLTTLLANPSFFNNLRILLSLDPNYVGYILSAKDDVLEGYQRIGKYLYKSFTLAVEKLRSILEKCDFDPSPVFADGVAQAQLAIGSI
jgi:hypothetical protein